MNDSEINDIRQLSDFKSTDFKSSSKFGHRINVNRFKHVQFCVNLNKSFRSK